MVQPCSDMPVWHYITTAIFQGFNLLLTTYLARTAYRIDNPRAPKLPRRR
jgi:hypothetical protein